MAEPSSSPMNTTPSPPAMSPSLIQTPEPTSTSKRGKKRGTSITPHPGAPAAKRRATTADSDSDRSTDSNGSPSTPDSEKVRAGPNRTRKAPAKPSIKSNAAPGSFAECTDEDKKLITLRDGGMSWADIKREWEKVSGESMGNSTLPNRYSRLKSNFTIIKEEDNARLIKAKQEIESSFEGEKWFLISKAVVAAGGDNYRGDALQRQYRKLMLSAGARPPPGIQDKDFEGGSESN